MTEETAVIIAIIFLIEFIMNISYITFIRNFNSLSIFNPIRNYNEWDQFNWFGIAVITILINIILFPYAIVYWAYKLLTVGRR